VARQVTSKSQHGLYEYDAVSRLRDSQLGDERVKDIANYIVPACSGAPSTSESRAVLLIDEIDKADIEFPNDLLRELDRMEFYVYETQRLVRATHRPIVFITSNNEKELPTLSCAAASSTTSASRTWKRWSGSSRCITGPQEELLARRCGASTGSATCRPEEKAFDLGAPRLDQAAGRRGHRPGSAALRRRESRDPAALWRAAQERAGRAPLRAARVPEPARGPTRLSAPRGPC
jgi:hypothetical protein